MERAFAVNRAVEDGHRLAAKAAQVAGADPGDFAAMSAGVFGFRRQPRKIEWNKRVIRIRTRPRAHAHGHDAGFGEDQAVRPALDAITVQESATMSTGWKHLECGDSSPLSPF